MKVSGDSAERGPSPQQSLGGASGGPQAPTQGILMPGELARVGPSDETRGLRMPPVVRPVDGVLADRIVVDGAQVNQFNPGMGPLHIVYLPRSGERVIEPWQSYNHILHLKNPRNQYLIMRHGESTANHERRWVAAPESCIAQYGLTKLGRLQVSESTVAELKSGILSRDTRVIASDYLRARESAEVARRILGAGEVLTDERLRERSCGEMEGRIFLPDEGAKVIAEVTKADLEDPFSHIFGLESTVQALDRFSALIKELEEAHSQQTFLLVCHGDLLRIGLSAFAKSSPGANSEFGHISNAAIYHLNRFLPGAVPPLSSD